jgi:hypothetical protein
LIHVSIRKKPIYLYKIKKIKKNNKLTIHGCPSMVQNYLEKQKLKFSLKSHGMKTEVCFKKHLVNCGHKRLTAKPDMSYRK